MNSIKKPILALCIIFAFISSARSQTYRILISNDDGIESPLLDTLYTVIKKLPNVEVIVSAPKINHSGSSHSSNFGKLTVERFYKDGIFFGYSVDALPADAVRYGINVLGKEKPFDLVITGINKGSNVGNIVHFSGTVGAAMEALYFGIPSISVSQERDGVNTVSSAKFVAQLVSKYQRDGAPKGVVISINIPAGKHKGVVVMPMGGSFANFGNYELIDETKDKMTYEQKFSFEDSKNPETDTYVYQQGYITITPLKFDWTAYNLLDEMKSWDLKIIDDE